MHHASTGPAGCSWCVNPNENENEVLAILLFAFTYGVTATCTLFCACCAGLDVSVTRFRSMLSGLPAMAVPSRPAIAMPYGAGPLFRVSPQKSWAPEVLLWQSCYVGKAPRLPQRQCTAAHSHPVAESCLAGLSVGSGCGGTLLRSAGGAFARVVPSFGDGGPSVLSPGSTLG